MITDTWLANRDSSESHQENIEWFTHVRMELFISKPLDPKMGTRFTMSLVAEVELLSQGSNLSSQVSDPIIFGYPRMSIL
jgi:hypothetical protein